MGTRNWQCPACGLEVQVGGDHEQQAMVRIDSDQPGAGRLFNLSVFACPNRLCTAMHASVSMHSLERDPTGRMRASDRSLRVWELLPGPEGRRLPSVVPEPIAAEFAQASRIVEISAPAAATLARRCLQALIRDFWNVKKGFLSDELNAIKTQMDPEIWEAIDAVRNTGNVGKHFEKGANLVVDADANEPEVLLGLIEYLVEEWYVARHRRQQRLAAIKGRSLTPGES
jgi:hypothetical protein